MFLTVFFCLEFWASALWHGAWDIVQVDFYIYIWSRSRCQQTDIIACIGQFVYTHLAPPQDADIEDVKKYRP